MVRIQTTEDPTTETPIRMPDARTLRRLIGGPALSPGDEGYHEARGAFNLTIDQRPALIAQPGSREEVAAVVGFAREEGLRVAPQRTGRRSRTGPCRRRPARPRGRPLPQLRRAQDRDAGRLRTRHPARLTAARDAYDPERLFQPDHGLAAR